MTAPHPKEVVLGLYPFTRGVAFAAFHSSLSPVDWGMKKLQGDKDVFSFEATKELIAHLQPDVLVLGDCSRRQSRPPSDLGKLHKRIAAYAESMLIEVHVFKKSDIANCFHGVGATTRYEIAKAIAAQVDALSHRLPPPLKPWNSQNQRLALFDAAALVMTYYCQKKPLTQLAKK
ncbi:MAG: hypothetical protein P4L57_14905 [Rhizomicrobium sp.]|nr:hypothetical protein [Rhizomicrobium sp.]